MSTAAASTREERRTFLLSKWIRRAVDEVDLSALANASANVASDHPSQWPANIRNSMALCSDDYLKSALKVARSLADQICEAEDIIVAQGGGRNNNDYGDHSSNQPPSLPAPGTNWADRIQVHLSSDGAEVNDTTKKLHFNVEKADFLRDDTE